MFRRRRLTVELAGGLGNQLFQYFAGYYLATLFGKDLVIDCRFAQFSHSKLDISSFQLPGKFLRDSSLLVNRMRKFFRYLFDVAMNRLSVLRFFLSWLLRRHHFDGQESFLQIVNKSKNSFRISGFFANNFFIEELKRDSILPLLELNESSTWFQVTSSEAEKIRPIMVHIRRGDFLQNANYYGILSEDYYSSILINLSSQALGKDIWVFTDSPDLVTNWKLWEGSRVRFILESDSPKGDPAEFMMLMTFASYLILGNSSFSYFAGIFASDDAIIYCPDHPVRGASFVSDSFYPTDWVQVSSKWA
jgi:hypothetical protein